MKNLLLKMKKAISNPKQLVGYVLCNTVIGRFFPDKFFLKIQYRIFMGKKINLKNPKTFNEKLQWLKLYDRKPEYTTLVDKYKVREYIRETLGDEYLIPLLGVWDKPEDIDFESLPKQFVLKCTHDSGSVIVCRDKEELDINATKVKLKKALKYDFYKTTREWPYKNVERKIIAETYIDDKNTKGLIDYKLYCFDGNPKFGYVSQGLENHSTAYINFVTLDWRPAPFKRGDFSEFPTLPPKPSKWKEMINLSEKLSKGKNFLRVDFYEVNGKIYFGELTFFPGSGYTDLIPDKWNYKLGDLIDIESKIY